ncbi:MAG: hypothetical protein ACI4W7_07615, partial [Candidatus Spyradenecus sp.]
GLLCLNGGTVTVEVNPDFVTHLTASDETSKNLSNKYWTLLIETVGDVGTNTVLGTMSTTGGTDAYADLYGLRTGAAANTVKIVNAGVDAAVSGFEDGSEYTTDFSRNRNQFVFTFGASASSSSTGSYEAWVNSRAVAFSSTDAQKFYSNQTPLNFTFGGTYLTTSAEAAAFTQGSNLKIARIAICLGRANADILTSSRYRFDPVAPATGTNWSNTSNWQTYGASAGDLPPETETVYTAPNVTATMDQAATVANLVAEGALTLAGANALTVSGDLSIPGTLTVNTTGGVSAAMLKTSGAQTLAGTGTLTIADVTLGDALTISGNLAWNASATTERSVGNAVKVTSTGSLTTTGKLKLNADSNELLGTTTVQSGILTVKTGTKAIGGTLTIAKDGTFKYGQPNVADALNYGGKATVNVYGTLEMNNTRWTLGSNNTLNFYPGATVNAGLQSNSYGALDAFAAQTINFKADDSKAKGGEITFNATLRARAAITLDVASGVTVNFSGGRSKDLANDSDDSATISKTGAGTLKVSTNFTFPTATSGPLQVAEGGTLKLTAAGNDSNIIVDEGAKLVLDCTTANSDTGNLNNKKVITNKGTVELANGHTWISINGGKTEVTGTFVFGFGIAGTNDNVFKTNLKIADGASLTLCGHRNTSAELTGLKNLGTLVRNIWGAGQAPDVGIKMLTGSTMSGTGEIQVNASAEAGVTLDASESKALTFSRGLTLAGPLAVKVPEAKVDLCTIQGTIPEVTAFTFAEGSTIGGDHCFVLQGGSVLQALKKVTLPAESEQSETLSETITRALEEQVRGGATTVTSIIATEAGGTEANDKRSPEAAELFTNVISAETVSDSEVAVKVSYDFSVSQMTIVNESDDSQTLLLCAKVSNVPQGRDGNSADYAKGTVVSVHRRGEEAPILEAQELTAEERAAYGVTLGQGEKWFAVPLDALSGQTNLFIIKASR